ncbi:hypothetical protein [Salinimonas chungwhensis]|uniref:hypothetical protein n=1 Tax=Salinimonas chungwhensis TaxID=265425 RepID=UPI00036DD595|nr:hypothetical protein [Salinimonas chungwhensis]
MKHLKYMLVVLLSSLCLSNSFAAPITFEFSQTGFSSGGSVHGYFRGTDLDNDGRIYASSLLSEMVTGTPFGNELDYAEVTFTGFGTTQGPQTLIYDKSVADMNSFENAFMAIAYNIDGGALGDDANEGLSLSVFSPSTNFWLGNEFVHIFSQYTAQNVGICDGLSICGAVLEFIPGPDPINDDPVLIFQDYTTQSATLTNVPGPSSIGLFLFAFFALLAVRKIQLANRTDASSRLSIA